MRKVFSLLFLIVFFGCNSENSFYSDFSDGDLYRLPLIKPYKLITNLNENSKEEYPTWGLFFTKQYERKNKIKDNYLNVRVINIEDSIIYGGPGKYERHSSPDFWFIINTRTSSEMIFEDKPSWETKLVELKCKQDTLYDIWPIFERFKKDGTLPWVIPNKR